MAEINDQDTYCIDLLYMVIGFIPASDILLSLVELLSGSDID